MTHEKPEFYASSAKHRFDESTFLINARKQAEERGYDRFPIVDVDTHHFEHTSWREIVRHIERGPVREWAESMLPRKGDDASIAAIVPFQLGNQMVGGRIQTLHAGPFDPDSDVHPEVQKLAWAMDMIGIDYAIMFPTPMLALGLHPNAEVEAKLASAYTQWLVEHVLPQDGRIRTLVYLPYNDPEESLRTVQRFGDHPGVSGFMVTTSRFSSVHDNRYVPLYAELQERGMPLAFHAGYNWTDQTMVALDKFISVHTLGFPFTSMVHMTNLIVNGIPERFPGLKLMWIEAGLSWVPFLMQRLDGEYLKRTSEAPLLKRLPSEYMRDMYFATQPLEQAVRAEAMSTLEATFDIMDGENTIVYSSDFPHWDWDLPSLIYDLPFLSEEAKRKILGGNAMKLLNIEDMRPVAAADSASAGAVA